MSLLSFMSFIVVVGLIVFTKTHLVDNPGTFKPEVKSQQTDRGTSRPLDLLPSSHISPLSSPGPTVVPSPTSTSRINIRTDSPSDSKKSMKLVYPGSWRINQSGNVEQYETQDAGDNVYNWYKNEIQKLSFTVRTNVKTIANDTFKAVIQAENKDAIIKVTIDREESGTKTLITVE